jgi:sterol desaturase/sphingolipid hydroxylase (fatty acid hydroxylase superfamily)
MTAPTATTVLAGITLLATGMGLWTFGEYVMHRVVMHQMKGKGLASKEHLRHHAEYDSVLESWWFAWAGILAVGVALGLNAGRVLGGVGWCLGIGWVAGYGFYDWIHYRAHRRPVAHPYERWVRRHHFHHHFGHPMANHGVTTPVWDLVFGTYERVDGPVRVPRRLAMRWLLDDDGAVKAEYAGDYELVGRRLVPGQDVDQDRLDHDRAFANLAPTP